MRNIGTERPSFADQYGIVRHTIKRIKKLCTAYHVQCVLALLVVHVDIYIPVDIHVSHVPTSSAVSSARYAAVLSIFTAQCFVSF